MNIFKKFKLPNLVLISQPFYSGSQMFAKMSSLSRGNSSTNLKNCDVTKKAIIGVCQMNSTSLKVDNLQTILDLVGTASARGAQVSCFQIFLNPNPRTSFLTFKSNRNLK